MPPAVGDTEPLPRVDGLDAATDIQTLQTVLAVAEEGRFRRTAARLGVNPSSISKAVRKLEDCVGVSLFERHCHTSKNPETRVSALTDVGSVCVSAWKIDPVVRGIGV